MKVGVPSFRGDLKQNVDIIEEVARIIGYDHLEVSLPRIQAANIKPNDLWRSKYQTLPGSFSIVIMNHPNEAIVTSSSATVQCKTMAGRL